MEKTFKGGLATTVSEDTKHFLYKQGTLVLYKQELHLRKQFTSLVQFSDDSSVVVVVRPPDSVLDMICPSELTYRKGL